MRSRPLIMKKIIFSLMTVLIFSGCTTTTKTPPKKQMTSVPASAPVEISTTQLHNIQTDEIETPVEKMGVIFGKTEFEGVLKTDYVRLVFKNKDDGSQVFQLYIADKSMNPDFPSWLSNSVEPGYFFIQLPAGRYEISMISIPVGSTLASEATEIQFEVMAGRIVYVGTLKLIGTKEKIKLGGFPVIQPGFDYETRILDEQAEGLKVFQERYPHVSQEVVVKLLQERFSS